MDGPPRPSAGGDPAVAWLLESSEPAIRRLARRDLLGEPGPEDDLAVLGGPKVSALLAGQQPDGGFGGHPYRKWGGAHWRLVSLAELGAPGGDPRVAADGPNEMITLNALRCLRAAGR